MAGLLSAPALAGQTPRWGPAIRLGAAGLFADSPHAGPLTGIALGGGRLRGVAMLGPVVLEDGLGTRLEATIAFHLTPTLRRGWGVYGTSGLAYLAGQGIRGRALLVLALGLEYAPGGRGGVFAEAGLGGGVRVLVGWQRRWRAR